MSSSFDTLWSAADAALVREINRVTTAVLGEPETREEMQAFVRFQNDLLRKVAAASREVKALGEDEWEDAISEVVAQATEIVESWIK